MTPVTLVLINQHYTKNWLLHSFRAFNDASHIISFAEESVNQFIKTNYPQIHFTQVKPNDEEWIMKDLIGHISTEYFLFVETDLIYPSNFLKMISKEEPAEESSSGNRSRPFGQRVLRASQQSKYGMGVVKVDIDRDYAKYTKSAAYSKSDVSKTAILDLAVNETTPLELEQLVKKQKLTSLSYTPDYKQIEYFTSLPDYLTGLRKDAGNAGFLRRENASGLPLYLLILTYLSLAIAIFSPSLIFISIIFLGLYFLMISLEALGVSSVKREGELFIGLFFIFPLIHHVYMIFLLPGLFSKTSNHGQ